VILCRLTILCQLLTLLAVPVPWGLCDAPTWCATFPYLINVAPICEMVLQNSVGILEFNVLLLKLVVENGLIFFISNAYSFQIPVLWKLDSLCSSC